MDRNGTTLSQEIGPSYQYIHTLEMRVVNSLTVDRLTQNTRKSTTAMKKLFGSYVEEEEYPLWRTLKAGARHEIRNEANLSSSDARL